MAVHIPTTITRAPYLTRLNKRYGVLLFYAVILVYALIAAVPILWMFLTSIRPQEDVYAIPLKYFPSQFLGLEQYFKVFEDRPYFLYTLNSLIVSGITTLLCLVLGTPAGYGLARGGFRAANYVLIGMLCFRLFPPIALLPSFYLGGDHRNHAPSSGWEPTPGP